MGNESVAVKAVMMERLRAADLAVMMAVQRGGMMAGVMADSMVPSTAA